MIRIVGQIGMLFAAALPAACDLAPPYEAPTIGTPAAYKEQSDDWAVATPKDDALRSNWWQAFHDPALDALEDKVSVANQDLKIAVAQFDEARADAKTAQADYYPTLDAGGSASRDHLSRQVANPLPKGTGNNFSLGLDLSYEIDVWGRVRNQAKSGADRAEASAGDLAAVALSLHAELATDYFILRGYDAEQDVLDRTVQDYRKALDLTLSRFKIGYAAKPDVSAAEAQFEGAETQATETQLKRANLEHAIAILTGEAPAGFTLPVRKLDATSPAIDRVLPTALLERRPDIAAAERRIAAANADIGVARAAYYPTFNINTLFGVEAAAPHRLFTAPAEAWSFGPSALVNLFDGGKRDALNDKARAAYDEAVAQYRQTVLDAFGEVEDNLAALRLLAQAAETQQAAVVAATDSTHHASNLYSGGLQTYYDVILAQNIELTARLSDVDIRTRRMTASVLLIKALGGGWQWEDKPPDIIAADVAKMEIKQ
jgi:outer membrane protein, multidrug efflux system